MTERTDDRPPDEAADGPLATDGGGSGPGSEDGHPTRDAAEDGSSPSRVRDSGGDDGLSRRRLVRLLVGLGIGIPVAVEGLTFLGLVSDRLTGGQGDDGSSSTATGTPAGVSVGDTFLPETAAVERLAAGGVRTGGDAWTVRLRVVVDNRTGAEYELRLGTLVLDDGTEVDGGASTGTIPPDERGEVTGAWAIPPGSSPATVETTVLTGGTAESYRVVLGKIPTRG